MAAAKNDFAAKLKRLFETRTKPDGSQYTQDEVVQGTGGALTQVYLWKLRTRRATNPGFHIIKALADFFGVEPRYFFESDLQQLDRADEPAKEELVDRIALRASKLDADGKKAVLDMIEYILRKKD